MSESVPEHSGGGGNVFTRKLGPLPMWAWMGIALAIALGFYLIKSKSSSSTDSSTSSGDTTDSSLVPEFVNQTYVQGSPPAAPKGHAPPVKKGAPVKKGGKDEDLTRTWTSEGGSTYAAVAKRLTGSDDPGDKLTPSNAAAKNWMEKVYSKNKNAKMPKGLTFTYTEGTVTST